MTILTVNDRQIEVDVEATREAYLEVDQSGCEECGCVNCTNFIAARDHFPQESRNLLKDFGIDWRKEADAYSLAGVIENGGCLYEVEFHGFGHMVPLGSPDLATPELDLQIGDYRGTPTLLDESHKPESHRKIYVVIRLVLPWVIETKIEEGLRVSPSPDAESW